MIITPEVYDCFPFFNELDLLEIRLNELDSVVDYFVLAEGTVTHQGTPKPLYFEENKARFSKFLHKIKHIVVDNFPTVCGDPRTTLAWDRERWQREALRWVLDAETTWVCPRYRGNTCRDFDIIISSDIDEIPKADKIRGYSIEQGMLGLKLEVCHLYMNYVKVEKEAGRGGTLGRILPFSKLKQMQGLCHARYTECDLIEDAGWHFSFMGGVDGIIQKIESYAHEEYNKPEFKDRARLQHFLDNGGDILDKNIEFKFVSIESLPRFVLDNLAVFIQKGYIKVEI